MHRWSLPSRERELKRRAVDKAIADGTVAPLAGARIETDPTVMVKCWIDVAPLAGARIETFWQGR